jgi:hypothetical protein
LNETKTVIEQIVLHNKLLTVSQQWQQFFKVCNDSEGCGLDVPTNMFHIVSAALSVPSSNAFFEWIFSLMNATWRIDRNRAPLGLIKSELQINLNFGIKRSDFYKCVMQDSSVLTAAASCRKY